MKSLFITLFLFVSFVVSTIGADITNGVFYADNPVECHLIAQSGVTITNQLGAGKTYMVENAIVEMSISNKTVFYFAGGPMIEVGPKSTFSINLFDQEVKNLKSSPRKAEFGNHNISLTFTMGEFSVIYLGNEYSSLVISTPFVSYLLNGGKYLIRLSDKSVIAYVLEGAMQVHSDKKVDNTPKGSLAVAIPFSDPASGVEDRVVTSIKTLKAEETERFASPILLAEKKWADVQFFVIGGRVIGIWMK